MKITVQYDHVIHNATQTSHSFKEMAMKHHDWLCDQGILYEGYDELPFTKEQFEAVIDYLDRKSHQI